MGAPTLGLYQPRKRSAPLPYPSYQGPTVRREWLINRYRDTARQFIITKDVLEVNPVVYRLRRTPTRTTFSSKNNAINTLQNSTLGQAPLCVPTQQGRAWGHCAEGYPPPSPSRYPPTPLPCGRPSLCECRVGVHLSQLVYAACGPNSCTRREPAPPTPSHPTRPRLHCSARFKPPWRRSRRCAPAGVRRPRSPCHAAEPPPRPASPRSG